MTSPRTAFTRLLRSARRQHGVAAIEFALVFSGLFLLLYGIATFGAALYTQQAVARAAGDGARASALFPGVQPNDPRVQKVIYDSLASSLIAPIGTGDTHAARLTWLRQVVAQPQVGVADPTQITVRVVYPYRSNPVLLALPLTNAFMPRDLVGSATAAR